jgi:pimeloyl-ACP methyl ester carboxylesterase
MSTANKIDPRTTGYAPVNGLNMYYEIYGEGAPIVLVHGSFMTIDMNYGKLIPELARTRKIIAYEIQGHGRTADIDRPFSFPALADDIAGLLAYLEMPKADILGFSLGAAVGLQLAISHPQVVNKLVFISCTFRTSGWSKEARDFFLDMKGDDLDKTPLKPEYDRLAPDKDHWRTFVSKMILFDNVLYDFGADKVQTVQSPVLMIFGDNDGIDLGHVAEMYRLLGGSICGDKDGLPVSQLAILPGATHSGLMNQTARLMDLITPFLDSRRS